MNEKIMDRIIIAEYFLASEAGIVRIEIIGMLSIKIGKIN